MIRTSLMSIASILLLSLVRADEATLATLEGRWVATRLEVEGADEDEKVVKNFRVFVREGELVFRPSGNVTRRAGVEFDPSTSPKTIVLTLHEDEKPDRTVKGIYALDNDTWKLCVPNFDTDGKSRPTEFKTRPGDGFVLIELRRITPKK